MNSHQQPHWILHQHRPAPCGAKVCSTVRGGYTIDWAAPYLQASVAFVDCNLQIRGYIWSPFQSLLRDQALKFFGFIFDRHWSILLLPYYHETTLGRVMRGYNFFSDVSQYGVRCGHPLFPVAINHSDLLHANDLLLVVLCIYTGVSL